MNRRDFVRLVGAGAATAVLAPILPRARRANAIHKIELIRETSPTNLIVKLWWDSQNFTQVDLEANVRSILSGAERNDPEIVRQRASDYLQMLVDPGPTGTGRILMSTWPQDDPDIITDPARPDFFHARQDGFIGQGPSRLPLYRPTALVGGTATHIIARESLVTFLLLPNNEYTVQTATPPPALR